MVDYVLQGLRNRRAELVVEIKAANKRLEQAMTALTHVDATIQQFDSTHRRHTSLGIRKAPRAEFTKIVLGILRTAPEALSLRDIAGMIMITRGLNPENTKLANRMIERVRRVVVAQQKHGVVSAEVREENRQFWRVAVV